MANEHLICDDLDVENLVPITGALLKKIHVNARGNVYYGTLGNFRIAALSRYGIYFTNNGKKMHNQTMKRCIAGRRRRRKRNEH